MKLANYCDSIHRTWNLYQIDIPNIKDIVHTCFITIRKRPYGCNARDSRFFQSTICRKKI